MRRLLVIGFPHNTPRQWHDSGSKLQSRCLSSHSSDLKRPLTDEEVAANNFAKWLKGRASKHEAPVHRSAEAPTQITKDQWSIITASALATFALHVHGRANAAEGRAFYTIGPCGEEFAGVWGVLLEDEDTSALHYRHLASQIARQLKQKRVLDEILLDRARGYVCSVLDPVTGGRHCALGGGVNDFYVTSTLASQAPPAVGRALASALLPKAGDARKSIHFVSFGDGSVSNAHFLTAKNVAENATFRNIKCPVLFCVTDNDISISLKGNGWMDTFMKTFRMPVFTSDGRDISSVIGESQRAFDTVRKTQKPAALLVKSVNRRFGHASTDRQAAYLSPDEIEQRRMDNRIVESICQSAVNAGATTFEEVAKLWDEIDQGCRRAFERAVQEPKLNTIAAIASVNQAPYDTSGSVREVGGMLKHLKPVQERMTMRKCMTTAIIEQMTRKPNLVYLGEDVRHGGYYIVTEGIAQKFPSRIIDFLPDETTLIGCGQGFSQRGLLPIVEIPYLKYLDCGADQFFETIITHWCTNGKQNHGLIFRMQGFDRGVFGGNFHTHNSLYLPPGLDLLCFSKGSDWVRGFRAAVKAAEQGRIVAIVDPTHALNKRHVKDGDDAWLSEYPDPDQVGKFEDITLYKDESNEKDPGAKKLVIVTYGNGVPDALLVQRYFSADSKWSVEVVDSPLLSQVPRPLGSILSTADAVLFADCCKLGQNPFGGFVQNLQAEGLLPARWLVIAAAATYNPLSRTETFLSFESIRDGAVKLMQQK